MPWLETIGYVLIAIVGTAAVVAAVHLAWRLDGIRRIRRAGPRRLSASRHRLWRELAPADLADLRFGPGGEDGAPAPPFSFVEEHFTGSHPCVAVRDARGRLWRIKWGEEAKPEAFAVRFAWALGYFAEVTHFVPRGVIAQTIDLQRARHCVGEDGAFTDARFELEDPAVRMFFDEHSWSWDNNPFVGTPQLAGLKIVNMLLSNWDTKDRRDVSRGSNTGIFEYRVSRWGREARYLITDWGGAMGRWGATVVSRGRWDVEGFEAQTPGFVTGVTDGFVGFAYQGQRTAEIARGITVADAAWFYSHASRLTAAGLRGGLLASGATREEADRFAAALLDRIAQIGHAAGCLTDSTEEPRRTIKAG
jgi:hypothetical protein